LLLIGFLHIYVLHLITFLKLKNGKSKSKKCYKRKKSFITSTPVISVENAEQNTAQAWTYILGLPTVPHFPERPIFRHLCPGSRLKSFPDPSWIKAAFRLKLSAQLE